MDNIDKLLFIMEVGLFGLCILLKIKADILSSRIEKLENGQRN